VPKPYRGCGHVGNPERNVVRKARFRLQCGAKVGRNLLLLPQISLWVGLLARSTIKCGATKYVLDYLFYVESRGSQAMDHIML
jgi:hypothetical protein